MGNLITSRVASLQCRVAFESVLLVDSVEVVVISVAGVKFDKEFSALQGGQVSLRELSMSNLTSAYSVTRDSGFLLMMNVLSLLVMILAVRDLIAGTVGDAGAGRGSSG